MLAALLGEFRKALPRASCRQNRPFAVIAVIAILMSLYKARDDLNAMMPYRPLIGNVWMIPMYLKDTNLDPLGSNAEPSSAAERRVAPPALEDAAKEA